MSKLSVPPQDDVQVAFLSILPRIEKHGRIYFRHLKCPHHRAEALQEMRALAWKWFVRLCQRGKDATQFVGGIARFAARAVKCGRRLVRTERAKDALSPRGQRIGGFAVTSLVEVGALDPMILEEALRDNTQSSVPDQVSFRCDFPEWRRRRSLRDRRLMDDLMYGERTGVVAQRYGLTAPRISQLRRELMQDWQTFCGDRDALGKKPIRRPACMA